MYINIVNSPNEHVVTNVVDKNIFLFYRKTVILEVINVVRTCSNAYLLMKFYS